MAKLFDVLDFNLVRDELASYAKSRRSYEWALTLKPYREEVELREALKLLEEGSRLASLLLFPSLNNLEDIRPLLTRLKKGGRLNGQELLAIALHIEETQRLKRIKLDPEFEKIRDLLISLYDLQTLDNEIRKLLLDDGTFSDNASPFLKTTRQEIKRLEKEEQSLIKALAERFSSFLSSPLPTLKNAHHTLAVNASFRSRVKGVVQDISSSGNTYFIEPEALLEHNARLLSLKKEEEEEERRLLDLLSGKIRDELEELEWNDDVLTTFHILAIKLKFQEAHEATLFKLEKGPLSLKLYQARHPYLKKENVVANDFILDKEKRILIISGPNAGGKTVALKTVGLLVLLAKAALPLPVAEGSSLSFFPQVLVDIGDSQSLDDALSTFSGHMAAISKIFRLLKPGALVLLDEVGTGTSPEEGASLAEAIAEELLKRPLIALLTSHFEELKSFALLNEGLENASMAYDEKTMTPLYRLEMGVPGRSHGLEIANKCGIPKEIIARTESLLKNKRPSSLEEALERLRKLQREYQEKERKLEEERKLLLEKEKEAKKNLEAYRLKNRNFQSELEARIESLSSEYETRLKNLLSLAESSLPLPLKARLQGEMHQLIVEEKETIKPEEETEKYTPKTGDNVKVESLFLEGEIIEIKANKALVAAPGGKTFKVPLSLIKPLNHPLPKEQHVVKEETNVDLLLKSVPLELNLLGLRYEEAETTLDKYLDECRLHHLKRVRIIHGYGSLALSRMTRAYYEKHRDFIERIEEASEKEGGGGATIFYLK